MILVGIVYLIILGLVRRVHVPVKSILQSKGIIFVLDALELLLSIV